MSSQFMRRIFSKTFAEYLLQKSQECQAADDKKSKEISKLAVFLMKCWEYFNAFDSSDYATYRVENRVDDIVSITDWLLKNVKNLTSNACFSLRMNKSSLQALQKLLKEKKL